MFSQSDLTESKTLASLTAAGVASIYKVAILWKAQLFAIGKVMAVFICHIFICSKVASYQDCAGNRNGASSKGHLTKIPNPGASQAAYTELITTRKKSMGFWRVERRPMHTSNFTRFRRFQLHVIVRDGKSETVTGTMVHLRV